MLFQKSAPTVGRSALAAQAKSKKFWAVSSAPSQAHPGFFVSTPQFTRHQQSQITPLFEDSRGAGNSDSYSIENPYLALTAGATCGAGLAHTLIFEEEAKDDQSSRSTVPLPNIAKASSRPTLPLSPPQRTYRVTVQPSRGGSAAEASVDVADALEQAGASVVDGILMKMHRLHDAGSHKAVLAAFESMEATHQELPIDAYNLVLDTLVQTSDVATQLQAYERMLARGVIPNTTTYSILLNSLVDAASELASKRDELRVLLGPGNESLESVAEVYEGLAAEEHLVLAQHILQAIIASRSVAAADGIDAKLQHCINRVVEASLNASIEVPEGLLQAAECRADSLIRIQPSIAEAATQFSALSPEEQQSEGAQGAMLDSYFRFRQPQGAIAFYSGCGAPAYLLKPLICGFAATGYVATANRWSEKNGVDGSVVGAALGAIPLANAADVLPSATRMFYRLAGGGGSGDADPRDGSSSAITGRCSFIRLCVAADHQQALLMAIRESKLVNCSWDATTIGDVTAYLAKSEPLLAADICNWQVGMLRSAHDAKNLKSYVIEEIVSNTVASLKKHGQLSLDAALRLLEVVSVCTSSRREVLHIVASSRVNSPHEVFRVVDSERAAPIAATLASLMNSKTNRLTQEELDEVKLAFPLLVRDCISHKAEFTPEGALAVKEALLCHCPESDVLPAFAAQYGAVATSATASNNREASMLIQRYALAPKGLDHALRILDDELRLGRQVSGPAVEAVLNSCVNHNATDLIAPLYSRLAKTQSTLNTLALVAAQIGDFELSSQCRRDLVELGVYPTAATYVGLLKAHRSHPDTVQELYNEAKCEANLALDAEAYNCVLQSMAQALRKQELGECLQEMHAKQFPILPQTYGPLLSMYVRLDEGYKALEILKSMSGVTKSLLEVKVFNHIMNYFVHKKPDRNSALEVFVELRNTGTLATPFTYRLLMEAYLLKDNDEGPNVDNADRVLTLMRRDGAPITTQCFATLLRARGVLCKDFDGARDFYRGLVKSSRVLPDKGIFKALMESYIINGKQAESGLVLDEMKRYHVPIDDDIASMAVPRS